MSKIIKIIKKILYYGFYVGLIIFGLLMMAHQSITNQIVSYHTHRYITETTPEDIIRNKNANANYNAETIDSLRSDKIINNYYEHLPVIGQITIPELEMNLPIFKGLDNAELAIGAGTMKEEQEMGHGNYALASHAVFKGFMHEKLLFSPLHRAKKGMTVYLKDEKNVYTYKITNVRVASPSDGYVINDMPGKPQLTLITCADIDAKLRLVVQGELDNIKTIEETDSQLKELFLKNWTRLW